jgi:nucleoside-diphosphate-sugar epimerase
VSLRILVIGGTRFIGAEVVRRLTNLGHQVTLFHRGMTETASTPLVRHIHGDRQKLIDFRAQFEALAPQVALDMVANTEQDACLALKVFSGLVQRVVVISSIDVYRAYERLWGIRSGEPDPVPLCEESPLRETRFPRRMVAADPGDWRYEYDKLLVERAYMSDPSRLPVTVLRLPFTYGPGDYRHRLHPLLSRMERAEVIAIDDQMARWRSTRGHVKNVAAAVCAALLDPRAAGRVYNIGRAPAFTEAQWVRRVGRAAGWQGKIVTLDRSGAARSARSNLSWCHHLELDTRQLRHELGFSEPLDVDQGLHQTIEWERANPPCR